MTMYRESKKEKKHRKLIPNLNQIRLRAITLQRAIEQNQILIRVSIFWKKDI